MASPHKVLISVTCKATRQAWSPGLVLPQWWGTKQQQGFLGLKSPEGKGRLTSLLPGVGETLLPGGLRAGTAARYPGHPTSRAGRLLLLPVLVMQACSPWVFLPPSALWHLTFLGLLCLM